jgi:hypothetical protein
MGVQPRDTWMLHPSRLLWLLYVNIATPGQEHNTAGFITISIHRFQEASLFFNPGTVEILVLF